MEKGRVVEIPDRSSENRQTAWEKASAFHGHKCPGLAMGVRMALAALRRLVDNDATLATLADCRSLSPDEEMVCVPETDACCVDALQALLGCSLGKGNLILKLRGKTAASFYYRPAKKACRIVWQEDFHNLPQMDRQEKAAHILSAPEESLLFGQDIPFEPPSRAVVAASLACAACGEKTAEYAVRLKDGKPYCLDCWPNPSRVL